MRRAGAARRYACAHHAALADGVHCNHCRHEVLGILDEKQRKVEPLHGRAPRTVAPAARSAA